MAEEKPDGENPGSDPGKDAPSDTTPVADVAQDSIVEEAPISRAPNFAQLVLSWGVFSMGSNSSSGFRSEKTSSSRLHQGPTVRCSWVDGWPA